MLTPSETTIENCRIAAAAEQASAERKAKAKAEDDEQRRREYEAWVAAKPARDAAEKAAKDKAAMAAEVLRKAQRSAVIASISNEYPGLSIVRRTELNQVILGNPTRNYILSGAGGLGKTTMLYALAQLAHIDGKQVLMTSGMKWESDLRQNTFSDFEDKQVLPISAEGLESCRPLFVGFDEVDKLKGSKFVLDPLHALIGEIISGRHQLVMTTNLSQQEFKETLGESLAWRLLLKPENNNRGGLGCIWAEFKEKAQ